MRGFHLGHSRTRSYTVEYHRINAHSFKPLIEADLGLYQFNVSHLSEEHRKFELQEWPKWGRVALFTIKGQQFPIPLKQDNRSSSNKLYLVCPCCGKQRQSLYAVSNAYACRCCLNLHYASQSESKIDRLARRIRKKRRQLWGADLSSLNDLSERSAWFPKPKHMRWKRFEREQEQLTKLEQEYWRLSEIQFKRWFDQLDNPFRSDDSDFE